MSLEIRVLGPLEVIVDGLPIRVDTRKALAIVALLAVEGRPYARDELATMFWPESDDESARTLAFFERTCAALGTRVRFIGCSSRQRCTGQRRGYREGNGAVGQAIESGRSAHDCFPSFGKGRV